MPFYLDVTDVAHEVVNFKSVLIVPCRFCPAASMAVRNNEPYIEFPRRFLKTASYERLINTMKTPSKSAVKVIPNGAGQRPICTETG